MKKEMKVGDMVELSASGRNTVYCDGILGKKGIVIGIRSKALYMYPILVSWPGYGQVSLLRSSLKYVSRV
tara:strand:+ start:663 stop:872 length:210 start_codon:yes stop_codon:yes gene_type:complete